MPVKLTRKSFPAGYSSHDFQYQGRPSSTQGDFGDDVGIVDMACVNQFGESNNSKYYHAGVVKSQDGKWWVYLEWGRVKGGKSWNGAFSGGDYQFLQCSSEEEARKAFSKQCRSKNSSRLQEKEVSGVIIWVSKIDKNGKAKDGYIVQSLATRERGLPDAYTIKDNSGLEKKASEKTPEKKKVVLSPSKDFHPQVVALAQDLVGGTKSYARAASEASGVVPTMESITKVRDQLIPIAMERIGILGEDIEKQVKDKDLIDISKLVASLVPTVIPVRATQSQRERMTILSGENILQRQQDLDAFEASLLNEDFEVTTPVQQVNPDHLLGAQVQWIDPKSDLGKWLSQTFLGMTNNRHYHLRGKKVRLLNMFSVTRPDRDSLFLKAAKDVAQKRKGVFNLKARLQPTSRPEVSDISDAYDQANIFLGIHGTRSVNVHPILSSNLRLPKSLRGVHITGAAFGGGIYAATDLNKSAGYVSGKDAYYGGGGHIKGRGWFMFLQDIVMGKAYRARRCHSWQEPPEGCDSIAAYPDFMPTLQNDEHIIFNPNYQRIRYIIEGSHS